jgi:hypothetical protein
MSLIFVPKIAKSYESMKLKVEEPIVKKVFSFGSGKYEKVANKVVPREVILWSDFELKKLTNLRAIGVTFKMCAKHLSRSANSCGSAVNTHNLYGKISSKRRELIEEAIV